MDVRKRIQQQTYVNHIIFVPIDQDETQYIAHENEEERIKQQFKKDLEEQFDTHGIYADKLFQVAWGKGHSQGYTTVLNEYIDLIEQHITEDELDEYL